jgi:hypothetical protein
VHLYVQGYDGAALTNFELALTNSSIIFEQEKVALWKEKVDLAKNIQDTNFKYAPDPTGIYTDSAQFTSKIPECTNISVGYYNEHTNFERQDIVHLERLCVAVCKVDWETLPIVGVNDTYDTYHDYDDYEYPKFSFNSETEWSYDNYSYFRTESGTSSKMFIAKTQIESEKKIISNWLTTQGFCPGFKNIEWNGNSLYVEIDSDQYDYIGERIELCDMIPELQEVQDVYVKEKIS